MGETHEHKGKRFLFKNCLCIEFMVTVASVVVVVKSGAQDRGSLIASTPATTLTFCYFVQKQKLDELKLFNDLFTTFNKRYDEMNA
jgi:hypothetical protein